MARTSFRVSRSNIENSFDLFDETNEGWLSRSGLKCAVASLIGHKPTMGELQRIFGNELVEQKISKDEFLKHMELFLSAGSDMEDDFIRQIFKSFDLRCSGFITKADFVNVFANSVPHIPTETVTQVFDEIDMGRDGRVSFREFANLMTFILPPERVTSNQQVKIV